MARIMMAVSLMTVLISGCVRVDQPIGSKVCNIEGSESQWEGTWSMLLDKGEMAVTVTDATNGELRLIVTEMKQGKKATQNLAGHLREHRGSNFITMMPNGDAETETRARALGYCWAKIRNSGHGLIVAWSPSEDWFSRIVKEGKFQGKRRANELCKTNVTEGQLILLSGDDGARFFNWQDPLVFLRKTEHSANQTPEDTARKFADPQR